MAHTPAARPDEIRRRNLGLVLDQIHRDGALSRAQLTQRLGLNRSTIGGLVADLSALNLVEEHVPSGNERAGRPSHVVGPRSIGPYAIAVDVDADRVLTAAVALGGEVLARRELRFPLGGSRPPEVIRSVAVAVTALREEVGGDSWPVGIGVSIPGTIRRRDHHVEFAPNLQWEDVPFAAELAGRFTDPLAVDVGNDADLGALAEHRRGAGRGYDDLVYLNGKIGVGGGIIASGAPLLGHDGLAGEVGHMTLEADGPRCRCGSRGCVEAFIGEAALLRAAGLSTSPTRVGVDEVLDAARAGEGHALDAVREVGARLGQAVASLVNLLNPQLVILGGSLSGILEIARDVIEDEIAVRAMAASRRGVQLSSAGLGDDSSMFGAAELAFRPVLRDPLSVRVPA